MITNENIVINNFAKDFEEFINGSTLEDPEISWQLWLNIVDKKIHFFGICGARDLQPMLPASLIGTRVCQTYLWMKYWENFRVRKGIIF